MAFFYLTYVIAILIYLISPDVVIFEGGVGSSDVTLVDFSIMYMVFGGYFWLSQHKNHPIIGPIYRTINFILIALFIFFAINYAKKSIKDWWRED